MHACMHREYPQELDAVSGRWVPSDSTSDDMVDDGIILSSEYQAYGDDGAMFKLVTVGTQRSVVIKTADGVARQYMTTCNQSV